MATSAAVGGVGKARTEKGKPLLTQRGGRQKRKKGRTVLGQGVYNWDHSIKKGEK